jgi:hypothetical protein
VPHIVVEVVLGCVEEAGEVLDCGGGGLGGEEGVELGWGGVQVGVGGRQRVREGLFAVAQQGVQGDLGFEGHYYVLYGLLYLARFCLSYFLI